MESGAKGLLAVWTDVEGTVEGEFNAWYNREHLGERAAIPGFLNARRYISVEGTPRYFAAYDTEHLGILGAPRYLEALANQTEWSNRILAFFQNTTRMISSLAVEHGGGLGGAMLTLRLTPGPGGVGGLRGALTESLAGEAADLPGIVRICVAEGVEATLGDDPTATVSRAEKAPDVLAVLVEGTDLPSLRGVLDGPLREENLIGTGAAAIAQSGLYRLQYAIHG